MMWGLVGQQLKHEYTVSSASEVHSALHKQNTASKLRELIISLPCKAVHLSFFPVLDLRCSLTKSCQQLTTTRDSSGEPLK